MTNRLGCVRRVLLIAFHFPPFAGSSGMLRMLKFVRYLPENGWMPIILTASAGVYEQRHQAALAEIPKDVFVIRAFAMDSKLDLPFSGRYFDFLALSDRWISWCIPAVLKGWRAIRKYHPGVIVAAFPIATTILIGIILSRLCRKPLVIDFRDPMVQANYPSQPLNRRLWRWIEERSIRCGSRFIFTAESARNLYLKRYPWVPPEHFLVIHNGYDEDDFEKISRCRPSETSERRLEFCG